VQLADDVLRRRDVDDDGGGCLGTRTDGCANDRSVVGSAGETRKASFFSSHGRSAFRVGILVRLGVFRVAFILRNVRTLSVVRLVSRLRRGRGA
jgi:hypothetical protein